MSNKFDNTKIQTIEDAKRYFQSMGCSHFHMSREYPERYTEYEALEITKAQETEWRQDEINDIRTYLKIDLGVF